MEDVGKQAVINDRLIELVRSHPALYNLSEKSYKDNSIRENAWTEISAALGKKVSDCKTRWRTIRDSYRKNKKKVTKGTGSGASKSRYNDGRLDFLDASLLERSTIYGMNTRKSVREAAHHGEILDDCSEEEGTVVLNSDGGHVSQDGNSLASQAEHNNICENLRNYETEKTSSKRRLNETNRSNASSIKKKYNIHGRKNLEEKLFTEILKDHEERLKLITNISAQKKGIEIEHPIQIFFRSMAATVMTFPPTLAAETRRRVCDLITEMELLSLSEKSAEPFPIQTAGIYTSSGGYSSTDAYSNSSTPVSKAIRLTYNTLSPINIPASTTEPFVDVYPPTDRQSD